MNRRITVVIVLVALFIVGCTRVIDDRRLAAELEPYIQPAGEAAIAAVAFRVDHHRWPADAAELNAFAIEHSLPFRAESFSRMEMRTQPDDSVLIDFEIREPVDDYDRTVRPFGTLRVSPDGRVRCEAAAG